ncbi:hypothetical protein, partial [Burkholderia ubonensis]|uniref:hypothetical protein n=1 Tax=Burkholderia ubonensis TaxID=101571 RepID=UPI000A44AA15
MTKLTTYSLVGAKPTNLVKREALAKDDDAYAARSSPDSKAALARAGSSVPEPFRGYRVIEYGPDAVIQAELVECAPEATTPLDVERMWTHFPDLAARLSGQARVGDAGGVTREAGLDDSVDSAGTLGRRRAAQLARALINRFDVLGEVDRSGTKQRRLVEKAPALEGVRPSSQELGFQRYEVMYLLLKSHLVEQWSDWRACQAEWGAQGNDARVIPAWARGWRVTEVECEPAGEAAGAQRGQMQACAPAETGAADVELMLALTRSHLRWRDLELEEHAMDGAWLCERLVQDLIEWAQASGQSEAGVEAALEARYTQVDEAAWGAYEAEVEADAALRQDYQRAEQAEFERFSLPLEMQERLRERYAGRPNQHVGGWNGTKRGLAYWLALAWQGGVPYASKSTVYAGSAGPEFRNTEGMKYLMGQWLEQGSRTFQGGGDNPFHFHGGPSKTARARGAWFREPTVYAVEGQAWREKAFETMRWLVNGLVNTTSSASQEAASRGRAWWSASAMPAEREPGDTHIADGASVRLTPVTVLPSDGPHWEPTVEIEAEERDAAPSPPRVAAVASRVPRSASVPVAPAPWTGRPDEPAHSVASRAAGHPDGVVQTAAHWLQDAAYSAWRYASEFVSVAQPQGSDGVAAKSSRGRREAEAPSTSTQPTVDANPDFKLSPEQFVSQLRQEYGQLFDDMVWMRRGGYVVWLPLSLLVTPAFADTQRYQVAWPADYPVERINAYRVALAAQAAPTALPGTSGSLDSNPDLGLLPEEFVDLLKSEYRGPLDDDVQVKHGKYVLWVPLQLLVTSAFADTQRFQASWPERYPAERIDAYRAARAAQEATTTETQTAATQDVAFGTASPVDPLDFGDAPESIEAARALLKEAYPAPLNMYEAAKLKLNEWLNAIPGNTMSADTEVNYSVRSFDANDKQWGSMSLINIALGTLYKAYPPNAVIEISVPGAYDELFRAWSRIYGGSLPVTDKLDQVLTQQVSDYDRNESSRAARNRLHLGMLRLRLASCLSDPGCVGGGPQHRKILTDVLEGRAPVYSMSFHDEDVSDVFAVSLARGGWQLFSTSRPGWFWLPSSQNMDAVGPQEEYTASVTEKFKRWLAPSLTLESYLAHGEKAESFDMRRTVYRTEHLRGGNWKAVTVNPYAFTPFKSDALWQTNLEQLAERLSELEVERARADVKTLLYTESEYWKNAALTFGKSVIDGWSMVLTMVGSAPGALGSKAAMLLGSLGLSATSTTLTGFLASLEDDPDRRNDLYRDMLISIALSAPGNALDAAGLLAKFAKARGSLAAAAKAAAQQMKGAAGRVGQVVDKYGPPAVRASGAGNQVLDYVSGGEARYSTITRDRNDEAESPTNVSSTPEPEVWRVQLSQPVPKLY